MIELSVDHPFAAFEAAVRRGDAGIEPDVLRLRRGAAGNRIGVVLAPPCCQRRRGVQRRRGAEIEESDDVAT